LISFDLAFHLSNLPSADRLDVLRFAEAALAARPQSASMYNMVGISLDRLGRSDEAIVNYRQALRLKPDSALARRRVVIGLARQGKLDEAIAVCREDFRRDSKYAADLAGLLNLAAWRLATAPDPKARDPARAVEFAKEAVVLMPNEHWNTLGAAHYRAGDGKAAIAALERSMEDRDGGDSFDWFFLAMVHWQMGENDEARKWYDQAVEWMEKNQPKNEELRRFRAEAEVARLTKAIELQEGDLDLRIQLGSSLREAGDFHGALAQFSEVITRNPQLVDAWVARGDCYVHGGEFAKGAEDFSVAIELTPDRAASWTGRATASLHLRQWDKAVADYSKAIELSPELHTNWWHRGHAYLQLKEWDKAAADFGRVVEQWPDNAEGWYRRGVALVQLNQPDQAVADLRQAIAKGFKNVEQLKTDSQLDTLRNREDFGKLLEDLKRE
jgi:tetratricopeptide (TPR) repeat protein